MQVAVLLNPNINADAKTKLNEISQSLKLQLVGEMTSEYSYYLIFQHSQLTLIENKKNTKPLAIDFLSSEFHYRQRQAQHRFGWRNELVAKAVGIKPGFRPLIIDATAGFGEDAFILASLGCRVIMIERSPILAALLRDAMLRLNEHSNDMNIDLKLVIADSIHYLATMKLQPDVIYLDPMFPGRQKSALVKKKMRILRELVGEDTDADALFAAAIKIADSRVVVKRPKSAPVLTQREPDIVYPGSSCRFDVYLIARR